MIALYSSSNKAFSSNQNLIRVPSICQKTKNKRVNYPQVEELPIW